MNKTVYLAVLVVGVVLLVYGFIASDSIRSDVSRLFTGEPTDRTIWLLVGGGILSIVGLGGLAGGGKSAVN